MQHFHNWCFSKDHEKHLKPSTCHCNICHTLPLTHPRQICISHHSSHSYQQRHFLSSSHCVICQPQPLRNHQQINATQNHVLRPLEGLTSTFTYNLVFLCLAVLYRPYSVLFKLKLSFSYKLKGGKSAQKRPYKNLSRELRKGLAERAHMSNLQIAFSNYFDIRKR